MKLSLDVIQFLHNSMQHLVHTENIYHQLFSDLLLLLFVITFLFFIQSGESKYEPLPLKVTL